MMFGKKKRFDDMGEVKGDTSSVIKKSIDKQQEIQEKVWAGRRPKTLAVSNPKTKDDRGEPIAVLPPKPSAIFSDGKKGLAAYWFPILCVAAVLVVGLWTFWPHGKDRSSSREDPSVHATAESDDGHKSGEKAHGKKGEAKFDGARPVFDVVRVESDGKIVVSGRFAPNASISVQINKKIVSTIATNKDGEFVYAPKQKLKPGNYTIQLISGKAKSDRIFLYVDKQYDQSLSLLMTESGSKIMQSPGKLADGVLVVSKIDYMENNRLIVQGRALPKLTVSLSLDDKVMGATRVSDHKNFGLGANVGELKSGKEYHLSVKLHDGHNKVLSSVNHKFIMPEMTDGDKTFYVVRRDDCLWVIARNFLGSGTRFSIIATENHVANPDLIYPDQKFKIPIAKRK